MADFGVFMFGISAIGLGAFWFWLFPEMYWLSIIAIIIGIIAIKFGKK